jgi:L-malate glycosyltransferase
MYPAKSQPSYGIFVKNFEDHMMQEGFSFHKVVISGRGKNSVEKLKKYLKFFIDIFNALRNEHYELIYVHYIGHSLLPILFLQKYIKKPLVLNAHGSDVFFASKIGSIIQKLILPVIKKSDLLVVPSSYFANLVRTKFDLENEKIFVSPSAGIDVSLFKPFEAANHNQIFTIGYVSRVDEGKGWDTLLDSVRLLVVKNIGNFKVLMIGGGGQKDLLVKKIDDLHLKNHIDYLGPKPHNELVNYYNKMDLFVFPTKRLAESLGLVGLEAMASGVPVVGSNIGGLKGYVKSENNGDLFEPGDSVDLAKKIQKFMGFDEKKMHVYKINAIDTAKVYDSKIVARKLADKLRNLKDIVAD